jgi:diaminopimelate decarboxylase
MDKEQLAARFGSPAYVYRLELIDAACADLRADLPAPASVYYSLKANPHPAVVQRMRKAGARAEVSSSGELSAALDAGFVGSQCLFTGPGKTVSELANAISLGVRRFSVESQQDLWRLSRVAAAAGAVAECLLRINVAGAVGRSGLRMTGTSSQFGVDIDEVLGDPSRFAALPGARVVGAHFFPLSNARDEESLAAEFLSSIAAAAQLRDEAGLEMSVVDLGGGFAAPYAQSGRRVRYLGLRGHLEPALDAHLPGWRDGAVEVAYESGRYLSGDCGHLICTITDVKRSKGRTYVVLDTGIHHLGGLAGLGRMLPVRPTVISGDAPPEPGEHVVLVGPLCTPADLMSRDAELADPQVGDILEIPNTGAYGLTASLIGFLGHRAPVELVMDGDVVVDASRLVLQRNQIKEGQQ